MPPALLISSIASLAPLTNSAYTVASGPVNEAMKPMPISPVILRVLAAAGLAAPAAGLAARVAATAGDAADGAEVAARVAAAGDAAALAARVAATLAAVAG